MPDRLLLSVARSRHARQRHWCGSRRSRRRRSGLEPCSQGYDERGRKMHDIIVRGHASWFVGILTDARSVTPL